MIPPATPVMQPMTIANQKGYPMVNVFCRPAIVKNAKPKVSNTNHALSNRFIIFLDMIAKTNANAVKSRYRISVVQNGETPSITSRIVPPPIATVKPHTYPPNQSKCFAAACLIPDIAKANVPKVSIITCNVCTSCGSLYVIKLD